MCVAFSLALVSLFFLLQVMPHSHAGGHDEPSCRLCQVAHLGIAPSVSVTLLSLILLVFGEILAPLRLHFTEPFSAHSPSRAPPAPIA
jgi:vacuolar-type H+-ATPase subunit I/STV1